MIKHWHILIFCLSIICSNHGMAQDNFSGTWMMETADYQAELCIGEADHQVAYPCLINIYSKSFQGSYYCLLAKKDFRKIFISRNKQPKTEIPFESTILPKSLTGILHYSKNLKGISLLELQRFPSLPAKTENTENRSIPLFVQNFFTRDTLIFKKQSDAPVEDTGFYRILQPGLSTVYFGIQSDTFPTNLRDISVHFTESKDNDIQTLKANNQIILEEFDAKKKRTDESFFLDTGINTIVLFAEDYGKKPGVDGGIEILSGKRKRIIQFNQEKNKNGGFILQRIGYTDEQEDLWRLNKKKYGDIDWTKNFSGDNFIENKKKRQPQKEEVIGEIISRSANLTFAIWDDAVEDGDSISLQINGNWIAKGFPVKNKVQLLQISLKPGPNVITFLADNLGSISPNTSVLEIIDGNKRKSFHIETDTKKTNQVRIYYEVN